MTNPATDLTEEKARYRRAIDDQFTGLCQRTRTQVTQLVQRPEIGSMVDPSEYLGAIINAFWCLKGDCRGNARSRGRGNARSRERTYCASCTTKNVPLFHKHGVTTKKIERIRDCRNDVAHNNWQSSFYSNEAQFRKTQELIKSFEKGIQDAHDEYRRPTPPNPAPKPDIPGVDFPQNKEPRCSCVLIIDVSSSMSTMNRIGTVNKALQDFAQDVKADTLKSLRADLAVVSFSKQTHVSQDFISGYDFQAPTLQAKGGTKIAPAILKALELCENRKASYRQNGITYYRSLIILLTDGYTEHDEPAELEQAKAKLREAENNKQVALFTFGVGQGFDRDSLARIVVRKPVTLTDTTKIGDMMQWLSNSLSMVSQSQPGETMDLPDMTF